MQNEAMDNGNQPSVNGNGRTNGALPRAETVELIAVGRLFWCNKRQLLRNAAGALIFFVALALLLPKVYQAEAVLLPPDKQDATATPGFVEQSALLSLPIFDHRSYSELFIEILRSRAVGTRVLNTSFGSGSDSMTIQESLGAETPEEGLRQLRRRVTLANTDQGMIRIEAEMPDPEAAAALANAHVAALDAVNKEKSVSRAKAMRLYIESQLEVNAQKLREVSDSLSWYQTVHQTVSIEDQARALLEQAGELKGNIMAREVELQMLRKSMKPSNPALQRAERELAVLQQQYASLQKRSGVPDGENRDMILPMSEMPVVAMRMGEFTRELKAQEKVWELLTQQYYQSKILEARDTPTVQVLDEAVPPSEPTWPNPALMGATGALLGMFLTAILLLVRALRADALPAVNGKDHHPSEDTLQQKEKSVNV